MKATKFILSFMVAMLFATGIGTAFGIGAGAVAFGATLFTKPAGATFMAVTPEIWTNFIVENLFKNNEFLLNSVDESQYVVGAGVVHIPQAGSPSRVERNRKQLPATITRRKDIDVTYVLDEFTTDPRFIPNIDKAELSYDKMESCMSEDMSALKQTIAEAMLYNWRPQFFIKTSGSNVDATFGTSTRKAATIADFKKAKEVFNKWGIPKEDRFVVIDVDMKGQLINELMVADTRDFSTIYNPVTGELKMLEGFTIIERQSVLVASNSTLTAVPKTQYFRWTSTDLMYTPEQFADIEAGETTEATTSSCCALFYQKQMVARALGITQMFDDMGNPQYYGDIYSFLQRMGGRTRRGDGKGVLGLIQVS